MEDVKTLVGKLTLEEKVHLLSGKTFWTTYPVERLGIPSVKMTDGPHGTREEIEGGSITNVMKDSVPSTCFPSLVVYGSSWDRNLAYECAKAIGQEAATQGVCTVLGPGTNIKRSPLCGRNFEYFSEDPVLSGYMASAVVKGLQNKGVSACPKHFACNNQETKRKKNDSRVSERALREIYLKGFEICVKTADPKMIMTSYNKVNGVYSCYNFDLCTEVLRNEWGFTGAVTTDWWNVPENDPDNARVKNNAYRVRAGNDVLMPGGTPVKGKCDNSAEQSVNDGALRREELENAARHVLSMMLDVPSVRRKIKK